MHCERVQSEDSRERWQPATACPAPDLVSEDERGNLRMRMESNGTAAAEKLTNISCTVSAMSDSAASAHRTFSSGESAEDAIDVCLLKALRPLGIGD